MTDLYKLEWIHSMKTIQGGMSQSLNKDAFMDTIIVCQDGVVTHNKLVLGLIFPELRHIPVFEQPLEQTLIMPDWAVSQIQSLISQLFPDSDLISTGLKEDDVEASVDNFEHFLETDTIIPDVDSSPRAFGMRRGRGRPPLSNTARMPPRFTCDFCHKGFFYRSMLTAHEKLHTGGSRETCELCGAEYSTRQNLKNHMIKHHGEDSFTPRKRGRPPLDPERRAAMLSSSQVVRPGYRGRGRPPLMTKHRGLTHHESYNNTAASAESEDLSAESFMEQKLEDGDSEIDEEKNLDMIRETALESVRNAELQHQQATEQIITEEVEDIKPDISSLEFSSQNSSSGGEPERLPQMPEHNNSFLPNQHFAALSGTTQNTSQFYNNESHSTNNRSPSEAPSEREYQVSQIECCSSVAQTDLTSDRTERRTKTLHTHQAGVGEHLQEEQHLRHWRKASSGCQNTQKTGKNFR